MRSAQNFFSFVCQSESGCHGLLLSIETKSFLDSEVSSFSRDKLTRFSKLKRIVKELTDQVNIVNFKRLFFKLQSHPTEKKKDKSHVCRDVDACSLIFSSILKKRNDCSRSCCLAHQLQPVQTAHSSR